MNPIDTFESALMAALDQPDTLCAGDHCKYCPAQSICPEKRAQAVAALALNTQDAAHMAEALRLAEALEPWIKSVREDATHAALAGARIPGFKLVERRTLTRYTEDAERVLSDLLGDAAYERKLIGMTQAKKLTKNSDLDFSSIITKPEGDPEIAPESDKRPALPSVDGVKMFAEFVAKGLASG